MILLMCIFLLATVVMILIASFNTLFPERLEQGAEASQGTISVLIPARNEATQLPTLLESITHMKPLPFEVIVCDDHSTDSTRNIIRSYAQNYPYIHLLDAPPLPQGWKGKNWACHWLAREAKGNYLLFLDADVLPSGSLFSRALHFMKEKRVPFLSIFPVQIMKTLGEQTMVPLMQLFLLALLPLRMIRQTSFISLAAANGQFMLFESTFYHNLHPHYRVRRQPTEDVAIAHLVKQQHQPMACLVGDKEITCRMYHNYKEARDGFARNLRPMLCGSYLLGLLMWCSLAFGPLFTTLYGGLFWGGAHLILVFLIFALVAFTTSGNPRWRALLFPLQLMGMAHLLLLSITRTLRHSHQWKGRTMD